MNAQQWIALADSLRSYALQSGHDVNASNMFVHTLLMRALAAKEAGEEIDVHHEARELLQA